MRYLITHSLHNSFSYLSQGDETKKQDFLDVLAKKPIEKSDSMLKGIQLEDDIRAVCDGVDISGRNLKPEYMNCVNDIADIVRGGLWQEKVYGDINLLGMNFLLYGKADVIKRDWIYDIKFTGSYDVGKYSSSVQHPLYMHTSGIHNFGYLVSDGRNWWREDYHFNASELERMNAELASMVGLIFNDPEMRELYISNWSSKENRKEAA